MSPQHNENALQATLEERAPAANLPVIHLGTDGRIRAVNRAFVEESGYVAAEAVGASILFIVHPDSVERVEEAFTRCLPGDDSFCTVDVVLKTGRIGRYETVNTPVWGGDGEVRSIVVMSRPALHAASTGKTLDAAPGGERRQALCLNDYIRMAAAAGLPEGAVSLSLSPRVPHAMYAPDHARKMAQSIFAPLLNRRDMRICLATRRSKGTIVISAAYAGPDANPAEAPWIPAIRKAAAKMAGGFHVKTSPEGGSEITVTIPILLPEKRED